MSIYFALFPLRQTLFRPNHLWGNSNIRQDRKMSRNIGCQHLNQYRILKFLSRQLRIFKVPVKKFQ
ncbi:MAG: hypothetical protein EA411_02690 [Saprospirales bacterium]|nr:MAG: hypothetical protein EA411_02690 [Saprospirales bacterium]